MAELVSVKIDEYGGDKNCAKDRLGEKIFGQRGVKGLFQMGSIFE